MVQTINRHIEAAFHLPLIPLPPSHRGNGWVKSILVVGAGAGRSKEEGRTARNEPSWVLSKMEGPEGLEGELLGCFK